MEEFIGELNDKPHLQGDLDNLIKKWRGRRVIVGMYDTGIVTCPHCKEIVEKQTKSFACMMQCFNLDEPISPYLVAHFAGKWTCDHCNKVFYIQSPLPIEDIRAAVTKAERTGE